MTFWAYSNILLFFIQDNQTIEPDTQIFIIILGALLMYVSIFIYVLPTESGTIVKARCVASIANGYTKSSR